MSCITLTLLLPDTIIEAISTHAVTGKEMIIKITLLLLI